MIISTIMTLMCVYRELESWVQDMQNLISAVKLAKDIASAEATLQGHRERKVAYNKIFLQVTPSLHLLLLFCNREK